MENTPQFSVIMPVYNVEKHLKDAVGSVLSQTYGNFELILVDDCSPDNSPAICDELVALDERIKVIHLEKNGGLSNARNNGISKACGEYVFFMDSDDIIEDYLFQDVYTSLEKNKADVVAFGLKENYYDAHNNLSDTFEIAFPKEMLLNNTIDVRKEVIHLEEKTLYGYACTKFYRNKKLQSSPVRFENITLIEDIKFNVKFFQDITSLNILNITPYNYQKRIDGSLTNKFVKNYFELHRERVKLVFDQYIDWDMCTTEVKTILANIYARYIFSALQRNCDSRSEMSKSQRKEWLVNLFNDELFNELYKFMSPGRNLLGILSKFLKNKNVFLCLASGNFIYFIKQKLPMVFAKAKQYK